MSTIIAFSLSILVDATLLTIASAFTQVLNFETDLHGIPDDKSSHVQRHNTAALSNALQHNSSGNHLIIPAHKTFYLRHGVYAQYLHDAIIQIDGSLHFTRDKHEKKEGGGMVVDDWGLRPTPCIQLEDTQNITLTSSLPNGKRGIIDGGGPEYWGIPFVGYLLIKERRPHLLSVNRTTNMMIENLAFRDAPMYTLILQGVNGLTVRYSSIVARRTKKDSHSLADLSAFNTDGIDVSGHNVHVHDVDIWNQDDCIAVKDNTHYGKLSSNMTFERINASGLGLTIGSIGATHVKNITFRDCYLHNSYKGIYMKFRDKPHDEEGSIEDIVFENITIERPEQWGIWIGPAQQAISRNPCAAAPCSLCWPTIPGAQCTGVPKRYYQNITLRDVTINNPKGSPGVILGHESYPIDDLVFDNVLVTHTSPFGEKMNWMETFPGLVGEEVPYRYVLEFRLLVVLGVLFVVVLPVICCIWRGGHCCCCCDWNRGIPYRELIPQEEQQVNENNDECDADTEEESPSQKEARLFRFGNVCQYVVLVTVVISFVVLWMLIMFERTSKTTSYFVCEGVTNGVALGTTWPVPTCFEDWTVSGQEKEEVDKIHHFGLFILLAISVMLCFILAIVLWHKRALETNDEPQQRQLHAIFGKSKLPLFASSGTHVYEMVEGMTTTAGGDDESSQRRRRSFTEETELNRDSGSEDASGSPKSTE